MQRPSRNGGFVVVIACVGAAVGIPASAAEFDYGVGYIGEYTTNINAVPRNARSEWINAATASIAYAENSETLLARLTSQVEYRDYVHNLAADNTTYAVDGSAVWTIAPRLFTWTVQDAARQLRIDATGPSTPANLTNSNIFETGPDAYFRLAPLHTMSVGARYTRFSTDATDVDNRSYGGSVRWLYQSTPQTTWSANAETRRIEFDDPVLNEDYRRNDVYLQLDKNFAQSHLVLLGGATRLDRERSSDLSGTLARASWTRNITADSTFGLSTGVGYQDTSFELLGSVTPPTAPLVPVALPPIRIDAVSGDIYYNRFVETFYTLHTSSQVEYLLSLNERRLDFQTTPQDRRETGGRFEINYVQSVTTTYGVYASYLKGKFFELARTDEDTEFGARYAYRMTRNTTLGLEARRHERNSTDPNADYVDSRYLISLIYGTAQVRLPNSQSY